MIKWFFVLAMCHFTISYSQNKDVADSCKAVLLNDKTNNDSIRFALMAKIAFNQIDADSMIHYANLLISSAEYKNNSLFAGKGYYYKSFGFLNKANSEQALIQLYKCIDAATNAKAHSLIANAYMQMGNIHSSVNNFDLALNYYTKAKNLLLQYGTSGQIASVYINLGNSYNETQQLDSSLFYLLKADSISSAEQMDLEGAYAKGNIGIVLIKKNLLDSAKVLLESSSQILSNYQHHAAVISYQLFLTDIAKKQNKFNEAIIYAKKGLELSLQNNLKEQIRDSYKHLTEAYADINRHKEANEALIKYYAYRDSILNTTTITQLANLRTEYEVGQKQAELDLIKQQNNFKTKITILLLAAFLILTVLFIVVFRNYQNKKSLSQLLLKQKEELNLAIQAKDRFFSVISHDLRSPIGAIGNLVILANDASVNNEQEALHSILKLMGDSNREVEKLLNDLLLWSISQKGAFVKHAEFINFNSLITTILSIYKPLAEAKNVQLIYTPSDTLNFIKTDENSWAVIIRNLLNNAIKFTHKDGTVEIVATTSNNMLLIEVKDNGIGMSNEVKSKLFSSSINKPQWGTHQEKGMGIGLGLVKEFVKLNNGHIEVESKLGQGSTFKVSVPVE